MKRPISQRERVLLILVIGAVVLVVNLFLFDFFFAQRSDLMAQKSRKSGQLKSMVTLLNAGPTWEERDRWLREHQPVLENEARAGDQLLNQLQEAARSQSVVVEQQVIGAVEPSPFAIAVSVNLETKSTWKALITYLAQIQGPDKFIVIDSANLRVDGNDATQMRGKFRISKWYAPR